MLWLACCTPRQCSRQTVVVFREVDIDVVYLETRLGGEQTLYCLPNFLYVLGRATVRQKIIRLACFTPHHCSRWAVLVFREVDIDVVYLKTRLGGKRALYCLLVKKFCGNCTPNNIKYVSWPNLVVLYQLNLRWDDWLPSFLLLNR